MNPVFLDSKSRIVRIDVDTQYGFCDPTGGLYVKGAELVIPNVARLNRDATKKKYMLIGSVDTHESHSKEFKENGGIWPPHCIKGTRDWLKIPETLPPKFLVFADASYDDPDYNLGPNDETIIDRTNMGQEFGEVAFFFEKDIYSIFDNGNAKALISYMVDDDVAPFEFQVYGVATDYCVKAAVMGIRKISESAKITLITDAIAAVDPKTGEEALAEMAAAGVRFATTAEVLG